MFEKEAETKLSEEDYKLAEETIRPIFRNAIKNDYSFAKYGVECYLTGYNKANEWHYVSKEGHPNKDDIYLTIRKDGLHLGDFCQGGDGDIDCQSWCDYPSEEEIQDDSVIAWKEIVLPELKESE